MTVRSKHGRLSFSNKDRGVGRALFTSGEYEFEKVQKAVALAARLGCFAGKDKACLIDVGANIGTVCIPLVRSGAFGRALAFEPEPKNYGYLVTNIQNNGLADSIQAFNCGLSSRNANMELELSARNSGDHRIRITTPLPGPEEYREGKRMRISVQVRRLDDFIGSLGMKPQDIAMLWLDVQGHEKHVVEGADRLIKAGVPVVLEFWPYGLARAGVAPATFCEYMASRFKYFYDLADETPASHSTVEIGRLFARYTPYKAFTDLLLVR